MFSGVLELSRQAPRSGTKHGHMAVKAPCGESVHVESLRSRVEHVVVPVEAAVLVRIPVQGANVLVRCGPWVLDRDEISGPDVGIPFDGPVG